MQNLKFLFLILSLFCCQLIMGQEKSKNQDKDTFVPFELTEFNNISIKTILNGKDTLNLMLHTGASSVTLTEEATKKIKSIAFNDTIKGIKSWGGTNSARFSEKNSLQIGSLKWDNLSIEENKNSGQKTDGKFGLDLFQGKNITIDFDKKIISISSKLPKTSKKYQKLKLIFENDMLFLEANCRIKGKDNELVKNRFFIHSGYSGAILLDDKFVADNNLNENLTIIGTKELKDSYNNIIKTKKAILPVLGLANQKFLNVPVGFFEGAVGRQKMSVMGGDILKRFNIIIDAKREYIYLRPNKLKEDKYI